MTNPNVIFNPRKLNSHPIPKRGWQTVFEKECREGDPREAPDSMMCRTKSEFQLLGRMYDKQVIQQLDTSGTPSFLGTQQSYLNMLRDRGLVENIVRQRNRYQLTYLGIRIYELNYWVDQYKRQAKAGRSLEAAHAYFTQNEGADWVNPKPLTEPNALAKPVKTESDLPPGVYPSLTKQKYDKDDYTALPRLNK